LEVTPMSRRRPRRSVALTLVITNKERVMIGRRLLLPAVVASVLRRTALAASTLGSIALLAVAAAPAPAASPQGQGLFDFGTFTREEIGQISIVGPKPAEATGGFTSTGETVITLS